MVGRKFGVSLQHAFLTSSLPSLSPLFTDDMKESTSRRLMTSRSLLGKKKPPPPLDSPPPDSYSILDSPPPDYPPPLYDSPPPSPLSPRRPKKPRPPPSPYDLPPPSPPPPRASPPPPSSPPPPIIAKPPPPVAFPRVSPPAPSAPPPRVSPPPPTVKPLPVESAQLSPNTNKGMDVFIIAGQSNAMGRNENDGQSMPPCASPIPSKLLMFPMSTNQWVDAKPCAGAISIGQINNSLCIGPEMGFGHALIEQLKLSNKVGIIPTAMGSTSLAVDWRPYSGGRWFAMVNAVKRAMDAAGSNARLRGVIWVQGENDAVSSYLANQYYANFEDFVLKLRGEMSQYAQVGSPANLPILMGVMSSTGRTAMCPYISTVRTAQLKVNPKLPAILRVDMADYEMFYAYCGGIPACMPASYNPQLIHLTKNGQCAMGMAMAQTYWSNSIYSSI